MSKTLDYYVEFIQIKFQCAAFQIWTWRNYTDEPVLMFGDRELAPTSPDFDEKTLYEAKHLVVYHEDYTDIQFSYAYGTRLVIRFFKQRVTIEEDDVLELYHFMQTIDLNETIKLRNKEIKNILSSTSAITSSLNLNDVLESIIESVLHVIPSTDAGHLMLYDEKIDRLVPQVQVGFKSSLANFNTKVGESITGNVFKDGKNRIFKTEKETINGMLDNGISEENYRAIMEAADYSYAGIICVPVEIHDKRIGVLTVHKWNPLEDVSDQTVRLLEGFANQAGIAIQNAYLHEKIEERLETITSLNDELRQRYSVHEQLTKISMENKGPHHIIHTITKMIEQPIVFYNRIDQTLYSTAKNDIDFDWINPTDIQDQFEKHTQPVYWTSQKTRNELYLFPIYNQTTFLGCFIILNHSELSKSDEVTLEQSSTVLALELVKTQTLNNLYYRKSHEHFTALIETSDTEVLLKKGEELNLYPSSFYAVAILEFPKTIIDLQHIDMAVYQLISRINQVFPHTHKIIYGQYYKVMLLISVNQKEELQSVYEKLIDIKESSRDTFRGGISNGYQGLEMIKKGYEEATKTLDYLNSRNSTRLLRYEEMGLNRLFLNQSAYEIDKFIDETFSVFSTDKKYDYLEETLLTYIELNRAATKTAETLNIHINTLYQRLDKIKDLLAIDFDDPEDLLNLQLACHLKKTRRELT